MTDLCKPHGRFPCVLCDNLHFENCACPFCQPHWDDIKELQAEIQRLHRVIERKNERIRVLMEKGDG